MSAVETGRQLSDNYFTYVITGIEHNHTDLIRNYVSGEITVLRTVPLSPDKVLVFVHFYLTTCSWHVFDNFVMASIGATNENERTKQNSPFCLHVYTFSHTFTILQSTRHFTFSTGSLTRSRLKVFRKISKRCLKLRYKNFFLATVQFCISTSSQGVVSMTTYKLCNAFEGIHPTWDEKTIP